MMTSSISEAIHDLYPLLINQPFLISVVASILVATSVLVWLQPFSKSGGVDNQEYRITKCPNPNCARCSRYAELNRSAQRRLPYVAKGEALQRIRHAIVAGPDVATDDDESRRAEDASPVQGQRPNVLLVRGLLSCPFVTELHLFSVLWYMYE